MKIISCLLPLLYVFDLIVVDYIGKPRNKVKFTLTFVFYSTMCAFYSSLIVAVLASPTSPRRVPGVPVSNQFEDSSDVC